MLNELLTTTLTGERDRMIADYIAMVEHRFAGLQAEYSNDREIMTGKHTAYWTMQFLRPFVVHANGMRGYCRPSQWSLATDKVAALAARNADAVIAECVAKVCDLDAVAVHDFYGYQRFTITGTRNGHSVVLDQQMIINVSPKGKLFNQYPARITVDGKAVPAAQFDDAVAA